MSKTTASKAWAYAIGLIKVDGLEPTEDFKRYIELEKQRKATTQDLKRYLDISIRLKVKSKKAPLGDAAQGSISRQTFGY